MMIVSLVSFVFGLMAFLMNHKHILSLLLCFEFMYLCVFIMLMMVVGMSGMILNVVIYLIVIVCEASLGLSLLVVSVFFYGSDKMGSVFMLKC
uniref:NADH-ubiquinone oxidoreductase chain 4L n=1 Tax=Argas miniatus TaxID=1442166 RepID=W0FDG3_ARGMI|nr:NADH dehydrogenase subunit 4L [Argas miniatus]AHF21648.1 NADH dehydrogenase subunit 4L [Argas miniatus]